MLISKSQIFILLFIFFNTLIADEDISIGTNFSYQSIILVEERPYKISLPENYDGNSKLPVLYVLDAEQHFNVTASIIDYLGRNTNIPPMMVVGIVSTANRENNMVPYVSDWSRDGGGADKFLSFFSNELIPHIDKNYNTSGFNILAGKSYGGLFALFAAMQKDSPFKAYISASPSVFLKDDQLVKDLWKHRRNIASSKFIYVSHATEDDIMRKPYSEVTGILGSVMTRANSFGHKFYMNELHETIYMPTLLDAMKIMFKRFQIPHYTKRLGVDAIIEHYESINKEMELGIEIPERVFSFLGNLTSSKSSMDIALPIFREGVKRYPNSSAAEYYLIRALLKTEFKEEARAHLITGIAKSNEPQSEYLDWFKSKLSRLDQDL